MFRNTGQHIVELSSYLTYHSKAVDRPFLHSVMSMFIVTFLF